MTKREPIPQWMREKVLERDGHACRYCGSMNGPFHMDHVYPMSKGGETSVENLVTSCSSCNAKKHNKIGIWPWPIFIDEKKTVVRKTNRNNSSSSFLVFRIMALIISGILCEAHNSFPGISTTFTLFWEITFSIILFAEAARILYSFHAE